MRFLLILLCCLTCLTFPVIALAGNANPHLYLEIYVLDYDPDDPGPQPEYLCGHSRPFVPDLPCFAPKAPYYYGILPIHVHNLDTPPLAQGWPPPCGPGGGYIGVSCGIAKSGVTVTFMGFIPCPGFALGAGTAPGAIVVSATSACHDVFDHAGYCKYMASTNMGATYFDIVNNADDGAIKVINCQGNLDTGLEIAGRAQWGGTKQISCYSVPVEPSTWGKVKALYR